jgi:hypothetical protein
MALGTPAWAAGSATHPARVFRHLPAALAGVPVISHANSATATTRGGGYGVAGGSDLAVTTTGALGYSVAAGHFALPGTSATGQGTYVGYNDAAVTGTLPARNATNPYIAYICVQIRDTDEDATGFEDATIAVIQGTPAASPAAPAVPSSLGSLLILSEVLVPSSANGGPVVFTERRMYLTAIGGVQRVTSALYPTGAALWQGLPIYDTTNNRPLTYNGSGWAGLRPVRYSAVGSAIAGITTGGNVLLGTLPITGYAGQWIVSATLMLAISAGSTVFEAGLNDGTTTYGGMRNPSAFNSGDMLNMSHSAAFAASTGLSTIPVNVAVARLSGTGTATTFSDSRYNRVDAIFIPDP